MFFKDRKSAGILLKEKLTNYNQAKDCLIVGLPRGGVVTAFQIAEGLHLPLEIMCPRKLRAPFNPELAIGAVTETSVPYLNQDLIEALGVTDKYISQEIKVRQQEAKLRLQNYRKNRTFSEMKGKTVIIVDDGLATGSTMLAAISEAKTKGAKKIIVAIPVSHPDTLKRVKEKADEVICLFSSPMFYAVGQFYEEFDQTEDVEVLEILDKAWNRA